MRIDQRLRRGKTREVVNRGLQPFAVGVFGVRAEERKLGVERFLPAAFRPGDPDRRDQRVVLAEPDEHAGEHPRDRRLGDPVVAPGDPGRRRALLVPGALVFLLPASFQLGVGRDPGTQVVLQEQDLPLEIRGEGRCRGHDVPFLAETRPRAAGAGRQVASSSSVLPTWAARAASCSRQNAARLTP